MLEARPTDSGDTHNTQSPEIRPYQSERAHRQGSHLDLGHAPSAKMTVSLWRWGIQTRPKHHGSTAGVKAAMPGSPVHSVLPNLGLQRAGAC